MSTVNPQTGEQNYNANERARMRSEGGVPRALPVSPEEEARDRQAQEQIKQERRATLNHEKKKESAWTESKLKILAETGGYKRVSDKKDPKEADMPVGNIRENLIKVSPIIFERLGEPREFTEDINIILSGFENEILVIDGNEMQQLNEYGKKYLLGLLIQRHIFAQGFSISVDTNNQPVLRDEKTGSNGGRQEQMKGLQDALRQFEFSSHARNILKKYDNSSLVAEYIAATTYEKHPNLVDYRNSLARKMGITSPNISPDQAQTILKSSSLTPEEKSFLLAWKDSNKDSSLTEVQKQQETFVKYAKENIDKMTPEMHLKELAEKPFTKSAQLLAGGAIGAALLYFAYNQLKKKSVWGTISGIIAGLIGGSIMLPIADKGWQALGWGDSLKNGLEGKPIDREQAQDHLPAHLNTALMSTIQGNWEKLQARLAGGTEGINILMNKDVGQKIATEYPVYSMLGTLNESERNTPQGKYSAPDETGTKISDIETGFKNLKESTPPEKAQLNTLLKDTWEQYKKTPDYNGKNDQERKKVTLNSMLASIEQEDGWFNAVINAVSDVPEKEAAMRVIGQNPQEWGGCTLGELETVFTPFGDERDLDDKFSYTQVDKERKGVIKGYLPTDGNKFPDPSKDINQYLKLLGKDTLKEKSTIKLRDFLAS